MKLITDPNLADPDGVYSALIALHESVDEAQRAQISARLILILANHIGDEAVLAEAIALAGQRGAA